MGRPTAVISGSTGTLGQAIAEALAQEGFDLWCGFHKAEEKAALLAEAVGGHPVRLSAGQDPLGALEPILEQRGRLDVLVNASGLNVEGPALALDPEDWREVFDVNFTWALELTRAALRLMIPRGGGRVIHISSSAARLGGRGQLNYAAAKAALERLVRGIALEAGARGVLINAVAPGLIDSPMARGVIARHGDRLLERIASRRFGRPEEVAQVVAFLAGPKATYINGAVIPVDGGLW
ncbi:MAG: SDR family oxidoreductase [Deltaproteobacteria bacterium]|jgi:NAD(P)-dependent dehydrogenase (short-subunit alcohol dehydrogenase family)|nr:SDR family oxidoreductase [Deltaproteobacteria bacterium]